MKARPCYACGMRKVYIEKPERNDILSLLHSRSRRRLANLDFLIFIFLTHYFYFILFYFYQTNLYILNTVCNAFHTHTARTGSCRRTKAKIAYNGLRSFSLDVVASWLLPPLLLLCFFIFLFFTWWMISIRGNQMNKWTIRHLERWRDTQRKRAWEREWEKSRLLAVSHLCDSLNDSMVSERCKH